MNCMSRNIRFGKMGKIHARTHTNQPNKLALTNPGRCVFGDESELKISVHAATQRAKANELVDNDGKGFDYYP